MGEKTLVIRADAAVAMGTGHVMRCLALAQAWQDRGGKCLFAMAQTTAATEERVRAEGFSAVRLSAEAGSAEDAAQVVELACAQHADWVVIDGYHFNAEYQRVLQRSGVRVLCIDDNGELRHYTAELVVNQNPHAREDLYRHREPYTQLLLGTGYVMLRREFTRWREWRREVPGTGRKVLVTMGGSDPDNVTAKAIAGLALVEVEALEAIVVVGGSNRYFESLQQMCRESGKRIDPKRDAPNMPELMAWADMAVIAAGGTLWELLFMGCPVLSYARNSVQAAIVSELQRSGVVRDLGNPGDCDQREVASAVAKLAACSATRSRMCVLGRQFVDGLGTQRLCDRLIR